MSTQFSLSVTSQSAIFFEDLKVKSSEKLIDFSRKHTNLVRFTGFPIALCSSLFDLAQSISMIGEPLIKGIANILGSPFSEKCKFSKGAKQISLQFPLQLMSKAIEWPLGTAYEILVNPIKMLISPTSVLESRKKSAEEIKDVLAAISNGQQIRFPPADRLTILIMKFQVLVAKHLYT